MDLGRVDRVTHIVALAVRNISDQALGLAELTADDLNDIDILHLIVSADIVHLAHAALVDHKVDGTAMVLNIEPVSHILALAVYRERLVIQRIRDHKRDKLLRKMIRTVIIRAAADRYRQPVSPVVSQHQKVSPRLRRAVRTRSMDRRLLGKEKIRPVKRQIAVHLIGRHLMIPCDTVFPAGIHQHRSTEDIRIEEHLGVLDRAVNMALSRKIDHYIGLLLLEKLIYRLAVGDIFLHEPEIRVIHNGL